MLNRIYLALLEKFSASKKMPSPQQEEATSEKRVRFADQSDSFLRPRRYDGVHINCLSFC